MDTVNIVIKRKGKYHSNTAFLDLLFNMVVGFVMLFIIAFLLISPITKDKQIEQKAEYIITVTWPKEHWDDVDTWLQDPNGKILSFRAKEIGLMHLDRDDLGRANDSIYVKGVGNVTYPYNREIATIRGIMPGEYILNVHMYRKTVTIPNEEGAETVSPGASALNPNGGVSKPVPVTILVEKINPTVKMIYTTVVVLERQWQEETVIRFILDRDGEVRKVDFMYYPLVRKKIDNSGGLDNTSMGGSLPAFTGGDLTSEEGF